jgi:hypothetical protein
MIIKPTISVILPPPPHTHKRPVFCRETCAAPLLSCFRSSVARELPACVSVHACWPVSLFVPHIWGLSYGAKQARRKCLPPSFPSLRDRKHKRQTANTLLRYFTKPRHSREAYVHVVANTLICLCYQKGCSNCIRQSSNTSRTPLS